MPDDKTLITPRMITDALGSAQFKLSVFERDELAKRLTRELNPGSWRVIQEGSCPTVLYKDNKVRLEVYSGVARSDEERRKKIAELVAETLNDRGVEV